MYLSAFQYLNIQIAAVITLLSFAGAVTECLNFNFGTCSAYNDMFIKILSFTDLIVIAVNCCCACLHTEG